MSANDTEFLRQTMKTLRLRQEDVAKIFGVTQPAISQMLANDTPIPRTSKRELQRLLARHAVATTVKEGKALTIKPCKGHTYEAIDQFLDHLERCPMCMLRAYRHITKRDK
jgi:predicted transcriptional regulator